MCSGSIGFFVLNSFKTMNLIYVLLLTLFLFTHSYCQIQDWMNLVPLKSSRKDVEKILGKPEKYLQTFGIYSTTIGNFYVWYSGGGCKKKIEGRQWNVPAQKLTVISLTPKDWLPIETYIKNKDEYKRVIPKGSGMDHRVFYFSTDETIIYQTITTEKNIEYVEQINLEPGIDKMYLLCKKNKNSFPTVKFSTN